MIYEFALYLAGHYGCARIIDLRCGDAPTKIVGLRHGATDESVECIDWSGTQYPVEQWISHDFDNGPMDPVDSERAAASLVVCTDSIGRLADPTYLLQTIRDLLANARFAILTTRERGLGEQSPGWTLDGFRHLLEEAGLEVLFHGLAFDDHISWKKGTIISVVCRPRPVVPPPGFRVVGLVGAYNEEDLIESFLQHTIGQGVEVFLLDNWSTDRTAERAARFQGRGLIGIEKFPKEGPTATHELFGMLRRKEELARDLDADWFIHLDPDEVRESPWPDVSIREALYRAQMDGFNAVNHICVNFHPVGSPYRDDLPLAQQFPFFEFATRRDEFNQVKAWKRQTEEFHCAESGGHEMSFAGRRVYPFKFLLRHYPIRSQEHGHRKVFHERLPRFSPVLRERGWHIQYDGRSPGDTFERDAASLLKFDEHKFYEEYLLERITGFGIMHPGTHTLLGFGT